MLSLFTVGVYFLGALLSYGRTNASDQEHFIPDSSYLITATMFSWIGFIAGITTYFRLDERQFFNFNERSY